MMMSTIRSTLRHLWLSLRALLFRRVTTAQLQADGSEPVLIAALSVATTLAATYLVNNRLGSFTLSIAYLGILAGGVLLFLPRSRTIDARSLLAVLFGIDTWLNVFVIAAEQSPLMRDAALGSTFRTVFAITIGFAWPLAASAVLAYRAVPVRPLRFAAGIVLANLAAMSLNTYYSALDAWIAYQEAATSSEATEDPYIPVDAEATFARQADLIDAALEKLAPSQPGRGEIYFVGMAPYSRQRVFLREIEAARAIMDERYDTRGHSILLVNHPSTAGTLPLASATNLERVLWRLAQRMDPEHDVLVLYVTSHGSEGQIAVTLPGFWLNQLTPEGLQAVLDRTGIKNRVIILSACHSGSFLPGLRGPDTLVMAAARADRASFGCSNERDWTYFGDALFNHALRETHSFSAAFDIAEATVRKWETEQNLSPHSEPQIASGEAIGARLDAIAQRLDGATDRADAGKP